MFRKQRLPLLLWFRLARIYNKSNRMSSKYLSQWNLTVSQLDLLAQIGVHQPIAQKDLAEKLFVTKGNITHSLRILENAGFVSRKQEWRTKYIQLTDKGERLYEEVVPKQEEKQAQIFSSLTKEEQKTLLELLKKVEKNQLNRSD
ncbi:MarR family transcriptional regulator [Alkalihalobacillus alcalophilus ATCC 27647 = CGMCC 1.3604]|uniref:MarR family transcriptional regulator n=1 Tax=Alkalihalobacillus alcalophilus ATCC 27647 = CGMCC 1.3604 TaxID=1218173 RepID=A0A094WI03_ALKAL|nr:MarR family transcriptional regulator [Alkalihalobacillus alcalophilus]KGA97419.1 MarR family transcriptional regulator [Alkalihalobacillus alcalophilus ATCC 27647 = CGMCC 1.3604]MED1561570.1 MarR family transcriptional regulator [Alkalihalobacillus alcalophilus]THG90972.1 MarR family transcriptional regulator [Alkalihalobacillus alcalophilus ATCC 27647 = CGMCC 1.3604]